MADPVTLATTSIIGSGAGGLLGAFGSLQSGMAKSSAYQFQAGISRMQAGFNRANARNVLDTTMEEAISLGRRQAMQMGQIKAAQAASGLDVNSGTAVDVRESQAALNAEDQRRLQAQGIRKAYAYNVAAAGDEAQAVLYDYSARNAKKEGYLDAMRSLISGATSVSSKWLQASQLGIY